MKSLRTCIVILLSLSTIGQFALGDWGQLNSNAKAIEIKLNLTQKILDQHCPKIFTKKQQVQDFLKDACLLGPIRREIQKRQKAINDYERSGLELAKVPKDSEISSNIDNNFFIIRSVALETKIATEVDGAEFIADEILLKVALLKSIRAASKALSYWSHKPYLPGRLTIFPGIASRLSAHSELLSQLIEMETLDCSIQELNTPVGKNPCRQQMAKKAALIKYVLESETVASKFTEATNLLNGILSRAQNLELLAVSNLHALSEMYFKLQFDGLPAAETFFAIKSKAPLEVRTNLIKIVESLVAVPINIAMPDQVNFRLFVNAILDFSAVHQKRFVINAMAEGVDGAQLYSDSPKAKKLIKNISNDLFLFTSGVQAIVEKDERSNL
jgi:hypothetical protein